MFGECTLRFDACRAWSPTTPKNKIKMTKSLPKRKSLHLEDFDYSSKDHIFFITICSANKKTYFMNSSMAKLIIDEVNNRCIIREIKLFCYCLMPDHLHLLIRLGEKYEKNLQSWIVAFKRYTSRTFNLMFGIRQLWQTNFYDHVVRKEESLLKICEYILNNPVRKGLVKKWQDYPHVKLIEPLPL